MFISYIACYLTCSTPTILCFIAKLVYNINVCYITHPNFETYVNHIRKRETTLSETNIRKKYNRWFEQLRHNWSMLIQIWFLLPEQHDFLNSAIPCPGPRPIQILTEFLSWNNHCPRAINHKGKKVTCHYFTHPFSHLPTVEKGVENHTLFYLSPHLFHIYTLSIFSLTLPWPQPL